MEGRFEHAWFETKVGCPMYHWSRRRCDEFWASYPPTSCALRAVLSWLVLSCLVSSCLVLPLQPFMQHPCTGSPPRRVPAWRVTLSVLLARYNYSSRISGSFSNSLSNRCPFLGKIGSRFPGLVRGIDDNIVWLIRQIPKLLPTLAWPVIKRKARPGGVNTNIITIFFPGNMRPSTIPRTPHASCLISW